MFKIWVGGGTLLNMWDELEATFCQRCREIEMSCTWPRFRRGFFLSGQPQRQSPYSPLPVSWQDRALSLGGAGGSIRKISLSSFSADSYFQFWSSHSGVTAPGVVICTPTLPFCLSLLKMAQAQERACISHISSISGIWDLIGIWQFPCLVGDSHMLSFKVYFCVMKISIFPGINLMISLSQSVLWFPSPIVYLCVIS